jgi:tRNA U34 5-methylaminomethyl-2-thiouridine-forming methyltransferase MnmC
MKFSAIWKSKSGRNNMEREHLEKRFGLIAVEKGYIKPDHLIEALKTQVVEDMEKGEHRLVGRILLEHGLLTTVQIEEILDVLGKGLPLLKEV